MNNLPRYPIYIISKGRFDKCLTANFLINDKVPFKLVVEPQESNEYIKRYGKETVCILPFSNLGLGSISARNWVWEDSKRRQFLRHWILDDNIYGMYRRIDAKRLHCDSKFAFITAEDFTDRYENIGITGFNYVMFLPDRQKIPPFYLNVHVYSSLLIRNELPFRWRGRYNEDTDLCLQVLSAGYCTILINAFTIQKLTTMKMKGGNTDELYKDDGRLKMARSLERLWPGVVTTGRRFKRPQHIIKDAWGRFDTQLIRRKDIDWNNLPKINEYGMQLKQLKDIKSPVIKNIIEKFNKKI
jgi:hypothetical protein